VTGFLEAIEYIGCVKAFGESGFWYGVATVAHYFGLFVLMGTTATFDTHLLGLVATDLRTPDFTDQIFPWIWISMVVTVLSGLVLSLVDAGDYYTHPSMQYKIVLVFLAFLCTVVIRRGVYKWDRMQSLPAAAKLLAVISLVLWLGAILAGNDIAALCSLG
jgi:hypothetical protein